MSDFSTLSIDHMKTKKKHKSVLLVWYKDTQQQPKHNKIYTAGLKVWNSIKKRIQQSCFSVQFSRFLRTFFLTERLQWLFFTYVKSFQVLVIISFFLKAENNRVKMWGKEKLKQANQLTFCNIFLFFAKIGSVVPVDQQIKFVSLFSSQQIVDN